MRNNDANFVLSVESSWIWWEKCIFKGVDCWKIKCPFFSSNTAAQREHVNDPRNKLFPCFSAVERASLYRLWHMSELRLRLSSRCHLCEITSCSRTCSSQLVLYKVDYCGCISPAALGCFRSTYSLQLTAVCIFLMERSRVVTVSGKTISGDSVQA